MLRPPHIFCVKFWALKMGLICRIVLSEILPALCSEVKNLATPKFELFALKNLKIQTK